MLTNEKKKIYSNRLLIIPLLLILWLLLIPRIMFSSYKLMQDYIDKALLFEDKGKVILAALILVVIYTMSEIIIFITAFSLGQKIQFLFGKGSSILVILVTITFSYFFLNVTFDYTWALATPFMITLIYMVSLYKLNISQVKFRYQVIILFQLILAFQWLEVNPALQRLGFGKSESAKSIIDTSYQIEAAHLLKFISLLICVPFIITCVLTFILIHINLLRNKELAYSKERELELQQMKIGAMESRFNYEMHNLVHDLKTPLTTIRGLISLVELQLQKHTADIRVKEYMERIEGSIQQLNEMISEILYEDAKRMITIQNLVNDTRANLVVEQLSQEVNFTTYNPEIHICINRIRLVRALINLIQNAAEATENQEDGVIEIEVLLTKAYAQGRKQEGVLIRVSDNGTGISQEQMMKIWDVRYSTKGSTGLGLPYVKKVVNDHNGWIKIDSSKMEGTRFTLFLPKGSA